MQLEVVAEKHAGGTAVDHAGTEKGAECADYAGNVEKMLQQKRNAPDAERIIPEVPKGAPWVGDGIKNGAAVLRLSSARPTASHIIIISPIPK